MRVIRPTSTALFPFAGNLDFSFFRNTSSPGGYVMKSLPSCARFLCFGLFLSMLMALPALPALAGNTVNIDSSVPAGNVYGNGPGPNGSSFMPFPPGDLLDPNNNTVNIISSGMVNGDVYGGWSNAPGTGANGNSVNISGNAQVDGDVHGGYSTFGSVTGNSVAIIDGTVNGQVVGGRSNGDSATGNSVTISGGTVNSDVVGGFTDIGGGNATGNTVSITGGTVNGNVIGGSSFGAEATRNTVTISGSPTFNPLVSNLQGGNNAVDRFTGNTLNVWNYTGSAVSNVTGFENFNFILPVSLQGLEVTSSVSFGDGLGNFSKVTGVSIMGGGSAPQPGQQISLINTGSFSGGFTIDNDGETISGKKGATLNVTGQLRQTATDLFFDVQGVRATPEAKALSEGYLAGLMLLNQSFDFLASRGITWAREAAGAAGASAPRSGFGFFGGVQGGWNRYNTGSHVDMSGVSLLAGLSRGRTFDPGRLTLGAFFEYGYGSYDAYNSFSSAPSIKSNGDVQHYGGGILGRFDANFGGYVESSFRVGGVRYEYRGGDLRDAMGDSANYDSTTPYYGIHLGTGYIWNFTDKASLDIHAKYFWTRQQGDSLTLSTDDPVKFRDVDSHRVRLGGRFAYAVNEYISPYIGAAFEHEFDGRARASTYGYSIDTVKLEGGTGIGELGLTVKPSKELPLSFDLGVQGYAGKREGVTGSMQIRWEF